MKIIDLKDAKDGCGGKAYGLYKLINAGVNVPNGFVIINSKDINKEELENKLKMFDKNDLLAVRSSGTLEDGSVNSFAGIFETILNVNNNIIDVINAINKVNESLNTNIVDSYSKKDIQMNIVIQKMIQPKLSGICFTNAIDLDGKKCVLFEYVEGIGEKIVSGKSNSNRIVIKINNNKLDMNTLSLNGFLTDFNGFNEVCELIQKAIDNYNNDLDIEWCIDKNNNAYLLQARPVTKEVFIQNNIRNNYTNTIVASRGCVEAETYVIDSDIDFKQLQEEINNFPVGKILVCDYTETYYLPAMKRAKGIITNTGSSLCHAAIVARELNIPCIVGYENATKLFPTGTNIKLDANNNRIINSENEMSISSDYKMNFGELDCFDNYIEILIDNVKVFIEFTLDGIYVHKPEDTPNEIINKIELFVRSNFNQVPNFVEDENKYLWIKEVERFKCLPYFESYFNRIKNVSKKLNGIELSNIKKELINIAKNVIDGKNKSNDIIFNIFCNEIIASVNELLDGIIPFGYSLYESYIQSLPLLQKEGIKFNDLFTKINVKNDKLISIYEFLKVVSNIKDTSYKIVWDLGGNDPDYFEKRDVLVENILKENSIAIDDEILNVFYNTYIDKYYDSLLEIINK